MYELWIIHPWHGSESLHFSSRNEVLEELHRRGFRFVWDYEQGRVVLYADGGYRAQVLCDNRDVTRSFNVRTNLPVLY